MNEPSRGGNGTTSAPYARGIDPAANPAAQASPPPRMYPRPLSRDQRTTIVYGIVCFLLILVILQLWLLIATMNAYLGGDESAIWPAAAGSGVCLLLNLGLLRYLHGIER